MSLLNRIELRYGRYSIMGLIRYVAAFNAMAFVLYKMRPDIFELLTLSPVQLLHGQIWRAVTYIFIPQIGGLIFPDYLRVVIYIYSVMWVGQALEGAIGSFRFTLYYILGIVGTTAGALISYLIAVHSVGGYYGEALNETAGGFSAAFLNSSMLLALARYAPDEVIYIFFVVPVKIKWLAWLTGMSYALTIFVGGLPALICLLAVMANYLLFFGEDVIRDAKMRGEVRARRQTFKAAIRTGAMETLHDCVVCHRTEVSHPDLEFRVSKDGQEYCIQHLPAKTA